MATISWDELLNWLAFWTVEPPDDPWLRTETLIASLHQGKKRISRGDIFPWLKPAPTSLDADEFERQCRRRAAPKPGAPRPLRIAPNLPR